MSDDFSVDNRHFRYDFSEKVADRVSRTQRAAVTISAWATAPRVTDFSVHKLGRRGRPPVHCPAERAMRR